MPLSAGIIVDGKLNETEWDSAGVIDTFYVTESDGSKIQDGVRIEQIRQILEEKI